MDKKKGDKKFKQMLIGLSINISDKRDKLIFST